MTDLLATGRRPTKAQADITFNHAAQAAQFEGEILPCDNRWDEFTEYRHEERPTPDEAQMMCRGCPIMTECFAVAVAGGRDSDGVVRAGLAWTNGGPERGVLAA